MKWLTSLLLTFIGCYSLSAQTFEKDTLLYNGDIDSRINIVVLSDGYMAGDLPKFVADASDFTNALFAKSPFREYKNYFNVFAIKVPSAESGADHPGTASDVAEPAHEVKDVNNYFGSTFDAANIHRLVVARNTFEVNNVLASNFPLYDQAFILVNSEFYGGSGGSIPVSTTHRSANEIAIHELGHSFTNLADEYWAGNQFAREAANMTRETSPSLVKWTNWYDDQGIGIYQHCCSTTAREWYKPHQECIMQFLDNPFCAVCKEAIVETIHDFLGPVETFFPEETTLTALGNPILFELDLIKPNPNTLDIEWQLNGLELEQSGANLELQPSDFNEGPNTLTALVEDKSNFLRIDNHQNIHFTAISWAIEKESTTGIEILPGTEKKVDIKVYPNPAREKGKVLIKSEEAAVFKVMLYDNTGKELRRQINKVRQTEASFDFDVTVLAKGLYYLKIWVDDACVSRSFVIQ